MKIYKDEVEADVRIGEGVVTIRRKGSSELVQSNIVSTNFDSEGKITHIWLDRIVHADHEVSIGGHSVTGAFVTEMRLNH